MRSERNTSKTCHACKTVKKSNRKHRGFYACKCGYKANADLNGAANIFMDEFHVSPWNDIPRTVLSDCSSPFMQHFHDADIVIAKGQGNFETLSDVKKPIIFLLQAKCPVIARHIGCEVGTAVIWQRIFM